MVHPVSPSARIDSSQDSKSRGIVGSITHEVVLFARGFFGVLLTQVGDAVTGNYPRSALLIIGNRNPDPADTSRMLRVVSFEDLSRLPDRPETPIGQAPAGSPRSGFRPVAPRIKA